MTRGPARTGAQAASRRRGSNRGAWALLVLLLLLLLGTSAYLLRELLFPPEPVAEVVEPPAPAPGPAPAPAPKKLARPAKLAPPKPVVVPDSQRQLLLKAIQARAAELKSCGRPPGSPSRLLTKIGVTQPGPVKSVAFTGQESGPKPLLDCVRAKVSGWNFADVKLASDVEVMVSFTLQGS